MSIDSRAAAPSFSGACAAGGSAELVVEPCGPHVLIRHRGEEPWERSVLTGYRVPPGDVVVLASAAAHRVASLPGLLLSVLPNVLVPGAQPAGYAPRVNRVWLAVSGVGDTTRNWSGWLHRTAEQFGIEILAPHGALVLVPGGTLFVAGQGGRSGWLSYRAGVPRVPTTSRYPVPSWDAALPRQPLAVAGLVADPVPAGLAVRESSAPPITGDDLAFAVPVHGRHPQLILGRPGDGLISPAAVAALIAQLHPTVRGQLLVVPAATGEANPHWLASLADRLGQDVVIGRGVQLVDRAGRQQAIVLDDHGSQLFRPFGTVLRQRPRMSTMDVVDIAPAPRGWSRCGPRHYRPDADSPARAEVTPSGLLLNLDGVPAAPAASFDPLGWTVTVGTPTRPVTEPLILGLERLLAGLTGDQLRTARIRVAGSVTGAGGSRLVRLAQQRGVPLELPPPSAEPPAPEPVADPDSADTIIAQVLTGPPDDDSRTVVVPAASIREMERAAPSKDDLLDEGTESMPVRVPAGPRARSAPHAPPVPPAPRPNRPQRPPRTGEGPADRLHDWGAGTRPITESTAGGLTVPGLPVVRSEQARPEQLGHPRPAPRLPADPLHPPGQPAPAEPMTAAPGPAPVRPAPVPIAPVSVAPAATSIPTASAPVVTSSRHAPVAVESATQVPAQPAEPVYLTGTPIADRPSGPDEQEQFAQEAAAEFNEALATVNAALATWPALRSIAPAGDQQDLRVAKIDFVAVCLYLGEGELGAVRLNHALRGGAPVPWRSYLPCLASGLRRLPTHRRPVVRQARLHGAAQQCYPVGHVLTEPGFLSSSVATDLTVPGADVDFLIWPRSARRTAALGMGRPLAEAVFFAGARFRVLAVHTVAEDPEAGRSELPRTAVLLRELLPHEEVPTSGLDAADRGILSKLDAVLAARRSSALRSMDDPDLAGRLAGVPVGMAEPAAGAPQDLPALATAGG
jgi:hypothetical protein